jgi:hypothetical protein
MSRMVVGRRKGCCGNVAVGGWKKYWQSDRCRQKPLIFDVLWTSLFRTIEASRSAAAFDRCSIEPLLFVCSEQEYGGSAGDDNRVIATDSDFNSTHRNSEGIPRLHSAVSSCDRSWAYQEVFSLALSMFLLSAKPRLNLRAQGKTPLFYAARLKRLKALDLLIEAGAHPTIQDPRGERAAIGSNAVEHACKARRARLHRVVAVIPIWIVTDAVGHKAPHHPVTARYFGGLRRHRHKCVHEVRIFLAPDATFERTAKEGDEVNFDPILYEADEPRARSRTRSGHSWMAEHITFSSTARAGRDCRARKQESRYRNSRRPRFPTDSCPT